jgi:RNA 2',3'-cyclic 3'-phosphodiesterase
VRLFVAVSPPEDVVEMLRGIDRPDVPGVRWTTEQQWHVTLRFLGEVDAPEPVEEALHFVPKALDAAGVREVRATLGPRVAWFPGRQVLQVPVSGLEPLARAVMDATARWGRPPEDRPFSGHLTLARARGRARGPASVAGASLGAAWRVVDVALVSSLLGARGPRYETLSTVALPGGTDDEHR